MPWKKLLALVTGSFDEELRLRNEYLVTLNRILRSKLNGRPQLKDEERQKETTWTSSLPPISSRQKCGPASGSSPTSRHKESPHRRNYSVSALRMDGTDNPQRHGCRRRFPGGKLIHDQDSKYCEHFDGLLRSVNIEPVKLPPRSPNPNPYAERFVLCLDRLILFSEKSLTYVLNEYITHYHLERNHQGIGNTLISPRPDSDKDRERDNTLSHKDLSPLSRSSIVSIPSGRIFWPDGTYNSFSAS